MLYVGKAASLKKRVASHFSTRAPKSDSLEMLTQVGDVSFTETGTALEAALLEVDEIHRLDPPYNVQLRVAERRAWFASRDFDRVCDAPDGLHPVGPLPSRRAVAGLAAMTKLCAGAEPTPLLRAAAVGAPPAFAPDAALFAAVWKDFAPQRALLDASRALHPFREDARTDPGNDAWTADRVRRHLERTLAGEGLIVRRARLLCLLVDAHVSFRDGGRSGQLGQPRRSPRPSATRKRGFDAIEYDRMRVLATELRRVHAEGGDVAIEVGVHRLPVARLFSAL